MKSQWKHRNRSKCISVIAGLSLYAPLAAHAQSNVTLYGIIDSGVDYISNVGGKRQESLGTGVQSPNLFGFRGSEDLGGGLSANFVLEGQFSADTGSSIGNLLGHQTYLGLSDTEWGSLTAGNQMDFMFTSLAVRRYGPMFPFISFQYLRQGPFNGLGPGGAFDFDRVGGEHIASTIKYETPDFDGFKFGAMQGLGGQPGSFSQNSSQSFGTDYAYGPFQIDAAYTYVKYPTIDNGNSGIRNWGIGGRMAVGQGFVDVLYTSTRNTFTGGQVNVYEVGGLYPIAPSTYISAAYQFMKGNDVLNGNKANQFNLTLDYSLSKRTDLYTGVTYQRTAGDGNGAQAQIILFGPADGSNQAGFRVGMRHFF
jgi:predicted porin